MLAPQGRKHFAPTDTFLSVKRLDDLYFAIPKVYNNPHPKGWGYTDKARLRGLKRKSTFNNRI
jgi:hypothetical protein